MSAYGIGQSYTPAPAIPTAPQMSMPTMPTRGWQGSNMGYGALYNTKDPKTGFRGLLEEAEIMGGGKYNPYYALGGAKGYWANPLQKVFGVTETNPGFRKIRPDAPMQSIGNQGQYISSNEGQVLPTPFQPQNFGQLTAGIQGLDNGQLQYIDQNKGDFRSAFGALGQHYTNAFANKGYASGKGKVAELEGTGIGRKDWSLGKAKNYLQDSYNQILNRLGDSYLL